MHELNGRGYSRIQWIHHSAPCHLTRLGAVTGSLEVKICLFSKIINSKIINSHFLGSFVWVFPETLKGEIFKTCWEILRVDLHLDVTSISAGDFQDVIFHL